MGSRNTWSAGPEGETEGRELLLQVVGRAARAEPNEQVETWLLVCPHCGSEEFEVAAGECFCFGCCLPMGVPDGWEEGFPGQFRWKLEPSEAPLPTAERRWLNPKRSGRCPEGHEVFEVAIGLVFAEEHRIRALAVGLRCPEDGTLNLYVDNAHVIPIAG